MIFYHISNRCHRILLWEVFGFIVKFNIVVFIACISGMWLHLCSMVWTDLFESAFVDMSLSDKNCNYIWTGTFLKWTAYSLVCHFVVDWNYWRTKLRRIIKSSNWSSNRGIDDPSSIFMSFSVFSQVCAANIHNILCTIVSFIFLFVYLFILSTREVNLIY